MRKIKKRFLNCILLVIVLFSSSCKKKQQINEDESWNDFYTTINTIKEKNTPEIKNEIKTEIREKKSRGTEIINGTISEIKDSRFDEDLNFDNFPDFDSSYFFNLYRNESTYQEFLDYYDQIVQMDIIGSFDIWYFIYKMNILLKLNLNLEEIKDQIINHQVTAFGKYRIDSADNEIIIKSPQEIQIIKQDRIIEISLTNPINKLADWYHYIFKGTITNIEKKDDKIYLKIENASIYIDDHI